MINNIGITYEDDKLRFHSYSFGHIPSEEIKKNLIEFLRYRRKRFKKNGVYVCDEFVAYCDIEIWEENKEIKFNISNITRKEYYKDELNNKALNGIKHTLEKTNYLKRCGDDRDSSIKNGFLMEKWV